jgi:hypothetical protein
VIVGLVSLGTALSAVGGWRYARASAPVSGPIVLLSVDALRADHLPVYGNPGTRTPAIDALARDGVVFERAYSHAPQTLPAHASLLTGRLPSETGVRDNAGFAVKRDERLLAEMLADRGYATAGVVSSYSLRPSTGIAQGFAFFDGRMPDVSPGEPGSGLARDGAQSVAIAEAWLAKAGTERAFLFSTSTSLMRRTHRRPVLKRSRRTTARLRTSTNWSAASSSTSRRTSSTTNPRSS